MLKLITKVTNFLHDFPRFQKFYKKEVCCMRMIKNSFITKIRITKEIIKPKKLIITKKIVKK
jgi:hypothetical protein